VSDLVPAAILLATCFVVAIAFTDDFRGGLPVTMTTLAFGAWWLSWR